MRNQPKRRPFAVVEHNQDIAKWCAVLSESAAPVDEVPEGWLTVWQICAITNKSRTNTTQRVADMVKQGKAERKMFRILTGRGVYPVPHYKLA